MADNGDAQSLRRLGERLDRASDAAERLLAEAAGSAARAASPRAGAGGAPPPAGWQLPRTEPDSSDLETVMQLARSLRDLVPPDLQRRLVEALRELLLALRALIDWYLERSERARSEPAPVEDIPIS